MIPAGPYVRHLEDMHLRQMLKLDYGTSAFDFIHVYNTSDLEYGAALQGIHNLLNSSYGPTINKSMRAKAYWRALSK